MLSVASKTTMLSVALPNVIMLNVELPSKTGLNIDQVWKRNFCRSNLRRHFHFFAAFMRPEHFSFLSLPPCHKPSHTSGQSLATFLVWCKKRKNCFFRPFSPVSIIFCFEPWTTFLQLAALKGATKRLFYFFCFKQNLFQSLILKFDLSNA